MSFSRLLYADWSNQISGEAAVCKETTITLVKCIHLTVTGRENLSKAVLIACFPCLLVSCKTFFSTNADFVVSFRNQLVIKDSFTDFNVGTMKWIVVESNTRVNWILKEVW